MAAKGQHTASQRQLNRPTIYTLTIAALKSSLFIILILITCLKTANAQILPSRHTCGYEACNPTRPGLINVHIICHTHLDTGWVETYDDYYYRYVQRIYDSVTQNLFEAEDRKFIAVETSYFSRWYNDQNETMKNRVHWLVRKGQLEFISGGWSMTDEATAHYSAIIDELTLGHQWLNATFGQCGIPKIGWQIDPFGHSREYAATLAKMGFDGLFLGRIDYQDKILRERSKTMEMIWKSSPSLGHKADIFTGVLPNVYWPPPQFCYDRNCFDETLHEGNSLRKAQEFIAYVRKQRKVYATDHIVITMGMDFYYRDARKWYVNLDRLISAVNSMAATEGVHMLYSTPSCYLKALKETERSWPVKLDDFFPYADAYNTYWTGYFTSRPSLKFHIMEANKYLQAGKQLAALSGQRHTAIYDDPLYPLKDIVGIMQHHDATTGTCKQFVNDDYHFMLTRGMRPALEAIKSYYRTLFTAEGLIHTPAPTTFCLNLNISECHPTERLEGNQVIITRIYNPFSQPIKEYVRIPVRGSGLRVKDGAGAMPQVQIVPIHPRIRTLPGRHSVADFEMVFEAELPPLGFVSYQIEKISPSEIDYSAQLSRVFPHTRTSDQRSDATIGNARVGITIDGGSGLVKEVIIQGRRVPLVQNFFYYKSETRFTGEKPSGAYALNPSHADPIPVSSAVDFTVIRGPLVEEVHQSFNDWIHQIIRIHKDTDEIEFDWVIGPIPVSYRHTDGGGKEIITKFMTDFQTNGTFFTDSNGRETIRRVKNYRPTWNLDTTEPVGANYYPVTGWIFIRDYQKDLQMSLLPDRSVGGSSLSDGSLELLLHRRLLYDDGFGMDEALNEPGVDGRGLIARGMHKLVFGDIQKSIRRIKSLARQLVWRPIMTFTRRDTPAAIGSRLSFTQEATTLADRIKFVGVNQELPKNIHIMTLEPWTDNRLLLRLEHIFEVNEDAIHSRPTQVSLRNLFTTIRIIQVNEVTLNGMEDIHIAERRRFRFRPQFDPYENYSDELRDQVDSSAVSSITRNRGQGDPFIITLRPMEIRTFLVRVEPRRNCANSGFNVPRRHGRTFDDC